MHCCLFGLGYVILLTVGGVPFLNRHFLPLALIIFILSAKRLSELIKSQKLWVMVPIVLALMNYLIVFSFFFADKGSPILLLFSYG